MRKAAVLLFLFPFVSLRADAALRILKIDVDGMIHTGTFLMIESALEMAKEEKFEALYIKMDTPGGMLDSTRDIVKLFLNTNVPILVFVAPRGAHAGSAGTFITMAAHVAAMAPGTNIGAAHPISATGGDPEKEGGKHLAQKVENDTVAFVESIAKLRGRNLEWAKKAVLESASITEDKALSLNVIDFIASDEKEFLAKANGRKVQLASETHTLKTTDAQIVSFNANAMTRFKNWLANPTIMFLLVMIAGMGLYIEMSHPGLIFPAALAGVAIVLVLIANSLIPVSLVGVGLILLGFGLLFAEIYITSFGLLAAGGIAALIFGALLLFDSSESDIRVPKSVIFGTAGGIGALCIVIAMAVGRTFKRKQIGGSEGLIGTQAVADEPLSSDQSGRIIMNGEYWSAFSDEPIGKGDNVSVVRLDGLKVYVKRAGG